MDKVASKSNFEWQTEQMVGDQGRNSWHFLTIGIFTLVHHFGSMVLAKLAGLIRFVGNMDS
jgi:hypothetical protein